MSDDTRTVEQIVGPIAERMKPCKFVGKWDISWGELPTGCPDSCLLCHGTGKVAEFPMLREPCGCISREQGACSECWAEKTRVGSQKAHSAACSGYGCEGRSRVPVITTDALLEAGKPLGVILSWSPERQGWKAGMRKDGAVDGYVDGYVGYVWSKPVEEQNKALALALEAALQQKVANAPHS